MQFVLERDTVSPFPKNH